MYNVISRNLCKYTNTTLLGNHNVPSLVTELFLEQAPGATPVVLGGDLVPVPTTLATPNLTCCHSQKYFLKVF